MSHKRKRNDFIDDEASESSDDGDISDIIDDDEQTEEEDKLFDDVYNEYKNVINGRLAVEDTTHIDADDRYELSREQQLALDVALSGKNVMLCGSAGSGKSHVLRKIISELKRRDKNVHVTGSTAAAAAWLNCSATTLHNFVGCKLFQGNVEDEYRTLAKKKALINRWRKCEVLVVEEFARTQPSFFEKVNLLAKKVRRNDRPFGDLQLIFAGDWAQIDPVREKTGDPNITFCFETIAWQECNITVVLFEQIFRQMNDNNYIKVLSEIREGNVSQETVKHLKAREGAKLVMPSGMTPVYLYSVREKVQMHNQTSLKALPGSEHTYKWCSGCTFRDTNLGKQMLETLQRSMPVGEFVTLKKGAMVILTANLNIERGLVNGMQGMVVGFNKKSHMPDILFSNGVRMEISPHKWSLPHPMYPDRTDAIVYIKQLPLLLGFAMTIHKCQSMTFEYACIDMRGVFTSGQAYTALSRVKTLDGLSLANFDLSCIILNPKVIQFYDRQRRKIKLEIKEQNTEMEKPTVTMASFDSE